MNVLQKMRKFLMLVTDLGFIVYWSITALHLLPAAMLFKDYADPLIVAWNWSFLPLDILASATGLASLIMGRFAGESGGELGKRLTIISLVLTMVAGLQALAFWTIRMDFDLIWWLANGFLLVWPICFLGLLLKGDS